MTTPASDCGVTAGCGACPLGRAGVCGDPGTPAPGSSYFRVFDAPAHDPDPPLQVGLGMNGHGVSALATVTLSGCGWCGGEPGKPHRYAGCIGVSEGEALCAAGIHEADGSCGHDPADLDPAEPRPADAGCAGGCCTR